VSPALDALKRLGATDPILVTYRGSFALAGFAQPVKPYWITQEQHRRYKGPSRIKMKIPLKQSRLPRKYIINSCNSAVVVLVVVVAVVVAAAVAVAVAVAVVVVAVTVAVAVVEVVVVAAVAVAVAVAVTVIGAVAVKIAVLKQYKD